jgi:hypothetical protein
MKAFRARFVTGGLTGLLIPPDGSGEPFRKCKQIGSIDLPFVDRFLGLHHATAAITFRLVVKRISTTMVSHTHAGVASNDFPNSARRNLRDLESILRHGPSQPETLRGEFFALDGTVADISDHTRWVTLVRALQ